jgi:hypothetical protein
MQSARHGCAFARQHRGVLAVAPYLLLLLGEIVPRAENPLPEAIGLTTVFALAGAGGVTASVICFRSSEAKRERWVRRGGCIGFVLGLAWYLLAVMVQVVFS